MNTIKNDPLFIYVNQTYADSFVIFDAIFVKLERMESLSNYQKSIDECSVYFIPGIRYFVPNSNHSKKNRQRKGDGDGE